MSELFDKATVGKMSSICGKEVECIHIEYEWKNISDPGVQPYYKRVRTKVIFAYLDHLNNLKKIELGSGK